MECSFLRNLFFLIASFFLTVPVLAASEPAAPDTAAIQVDTGRLYFNDGRFADALDAWNKALAEYRAKDDKRGEASVLLRKAEAYLSIGQSYNAINNLKSALELAQEAGDEPLATRIAGSLGTAYLMVNRVDEARTLLEKAVQQERALPVQ